MASRTDERTGVTMHRVVSERSPLLPGRESRPNRRGKLTALLLVFQGLFLGLFVEFVRYGPPAGSPAGSGPTIDHYYPMFQDVHVMIFVGFGFLMTFLKLYGYGSVGFNMLVAAFVLQWATLMRGFLYMEDNTINLDIKSMLSADFAAAAVLISYGAVLGKTTPVQLVVMAFLEIPFLVVNEWIGTVQFQALDIGGSMFVHVFGAYFGLTVARMLYRPEASDSTKEGANYNSDLFSMIGSVFLWMYWPSFNSALAVGDGRYRAVINTYLSLSACAVVTFAMSSAFDKDGRVNMVHVQNATLAGGVAVGTTADMMIQPWGALLIGIIAGTLSTVGFTVVQPFLARLKFHDTCGVNNLHGMPGLLAGVAGVVASLLKLCELGDRSAAVQAEFQMAALFVTIGIALLGGTITGIILQLPVWGKLQSEELFDDRANWEMPGDEDDCEPQPTPSIITDAE
ncbi:RHAG [Branchiostoma lanceolatum]|uniref:RHAG protein n=1 Tax=Branchiostoma lanceolatum TaxID=7740 RepID=A0A8J9ZXB9_BRALA|nr:RHAG [Branchiostoma lanceolatum]